MPSLITASKRVQELFIKYAQSISWQYITTGKALIFHFKNKV